MKSIRDLWQKFKSSEPIAKLRSVKNVEIVLAAILALIAIVAYFAISANGRKSRYAPTLATEVKMTDEEQRLSALLSKIQGIGEARVYISYGDKKDVTGVVIVAKGADTSEKRVSVVRCVEIATGASVDQIQIFQMENGG
ncbi:MAG: hypothetical protein K5753_00335 [Clostridia bacterium]|nr:hypothetical protein [Clostridia bacterium]